jgi:hypothetical protein
MAGSATCLDATPLVMCEIDNERSLKIVSKAIVMQMFSSERTEAKHGNFLPFDEHEIAR